MTLNYINPSFTIADRKVGPGHPAYVIAEIGHNHGGNVGTAKRLIEVAAEAGADAVKTQVRTNPRLYTRAFFDHPYNSENAYGKTYGLHREALEFNVDDLLRLRSHAVAFGIHFFATAFDPWALETCLTLDLPAIKFASGDLTNHALLEQGARSGLPVIISTGGADLWTVKGAWDVICDAGAESRTAVLQCTASYPCAFSDLNLSVITTYKQEFGCVVGASLHDNGIAMAVGAVALGASLVEKHFTLDRTMKGTDHNFSLEPQGFAKMVRDIRRFEASLGDGLKKALDCEAEPIRKMSKALYTKRSLPAGHVLTAGDIVALSPGGGIPPALVSSVVGRRLTRCLDTEEMICAEHLEAADPAADRASVA